MAALKPSVRKWTGDEDEVLIAARLAAPPDVSTRLLARRMAAGMARTEESLIQRYGRLKVLIDDRIAERAAARAAATCGRARRGVAINRRGMRKCLCCGIDFMSEGPGNRLCQTCRHKDVSPYAPGGG